MESEQELSESRIRDQLHRVLSTPAFQHSVILSEFLRFIIDETLAGRSREIKEYTIGINVLSRKPDFNPQLDSIVRMHAGRLRRALNEYYNESGKNDSVRIEVPKGAYVPNFQSQSAIRDAQVFEKVRITSRRPTVAVLPFRNMSDAASRDFFADGFGEQLNTELTQFQDLLVISYYSSRHVAEKTTDLKDASKLLGAKYIVTGSIQNENKNMLIRAQLIVGDTGEQLWAKSFERKNTDSGLFEIQHEIVKNILNAIGGYWGVIFRDVMKTPNHNYTNNVGVYDAVFWYYHFQKIGTTEIYLKSVNALEVAVETDPNYALAWAMLSELYMNDMAYIFKKIDSPMKRALDCAVHAVSIDPNCQHGYQALAWVYLFRHERDLCFKAVSKCIAINPNAGDRVGAMGFVLVCAGEFEQGYELLNDSTLNNPYCPWWMYGSYVFYFLQKKDYRTAFDYVQKIDMPGTFWDPLLKAVALGHLDRIEEAGRMVNQLIQLMPDAGNNVKNVFEAFLLSQELRNELLAGLRKAGLHTSPKKEIEIEKIISEASSN